MVGALVEQYRACISNDIQATHQAIVGIDQPVLIDINVVDLDRVGRVLRRRLGDEIADFHRMTGVADRASPEASVASSVWKARPRDTIGSTVCAKPLPALCHDRCMTSLGCALSEISNHPAAVDPTDISTVRLVGWDDGRAHAYPCVEGRDTPQDARAQVSDMVGIGATP